MRTTIGASLLLLLLASPWAYGRPEYALKVRQDCRACHVNPWGGGPRTVYGKLYGSRDYPMAKTSTSDLYSGDLRAIAYYPRFASQTANGAALMEAAASANVPITQGEGAQEMRVAATYNASPLQSGVREAYFQWQPFAEPGAALESLMVGRFNAPFGLLTDEHRTYTRMQTDMTLNNFEMGAAFSGALLQGLHYDLALTQDFLSGGGAFATGDLTWGEIFNLRWMPSTLPFLLGASENFLRTLSNPEPFAFSAYAAISGDRLTGGWLHLTLSGEAVIAKNWNNAQLNPNLAAFFIPANDAAYSSAIAQSRSLGYYALARYELSPRWALIYKFDWLAFDTGYEGDAFTRNGAGLEWYPASNLILDVRLEKGTSGRPEISPLDALAAQDDVLAMFRIWL